MILPAKQDFRLSICDFFQFNIVTSLIILIPNFISYGSFEYVCGVEQASRTAIGTYPWMGLLVYQLGSSDDRSSTRKGEMTSSVILITHQFVITTASEIEKYPKHNFRKRAVVIFGHNYTRHIPQQFYRVIQYTYHQDFASKFFTTMAILQLEEKNTIQVLMPVCAPPHKFTEPITNISAMSLIRDRYGSTINVYDMQYIEEERCRDYYLKNNLDSKSMWPRFVTCAQGTKTEGQCLWKNGVALVAKSNNKWHLLGVGISGPACKAPTRFLDYTMYVNWVREALSRIGRVAVTRINKGFLVIRRSRTTLQRYGPCDTEEKERNFHSEKTEVLAPRDPILNGTVIYNLTLFEKIEYTCVVLQAWYLSRGNADPPPELKIRKWCKSDTFVCTESEFSTLHFHVIIKFHRRIQYKVNCFGHLTKYLEAQQMLLLSNLGKKGPSLAWKVPWLKPNDYQDPPPIPRSNADTTRIDM